MFLKYENEKKKRERKEEEENGPIVLSNFSSFMWLVFLVFKVGMRYIFLRKSVIAQIIKAVYVSFCGLGVMSYDRALRGIENDLTERRCI